MISGCLVDDTRAYLMAHYDLHINESAIRIFLFTKCMFKEGVIRTFSFVLNVFIKHTWEFTYNEKCHR